MALRLVGAQTQIALKGDLDLGRQRAAVARSWPWQDSRIERIRSTKRAARVLGGDGGLRPLMPLVRKAAADLVAAGDIEVTQGGRVVDLATARGAIRLRLRKRARAI